MTEPTKAFLCNAPRAKEGTFCTLSAGKGTDHPGTGHCHLHGGGKATENARKHAPFLEAQARGLSMADMESLYDMSNKGLVLARALAVQRLIHGQPSSREASDLTMAIQRIDKVLDSVGFDTEDNPDMPDNSGETDPLTEELARLNALDN